MEKTYVNLYIPCNISYLPYLYSICFAVDETSLLSRSEKHLPFFSYTTKHIFARTHRSIVIKAEVSVCALCYDDDDPTNVYMNVYECNE